MSVLRSTYYSETLPDLDRYGTIISLDYMEVHVARSYYEHVHISIGDEEINLTIEDAEAILAGLQAAIASAIKGRNFRK